MRNVIFVAPFPLETTLRFARAVASLDGVRLLGIHARPASGPDARIFADTATVADALDPEQLVAAARSLARRHGPVHRVLGILEPLQVPLARIREALDVEGPDVRTAELFRDKARMKDALREHGLPCARHARITSRADADRFADEVGFPLVLKPLEGMGCLATWRIERRESLHAAVDALAVSRTHPALAEEFLRGRELSFETLTLGGEPRFRSFTEYLPPPLEVTENDWIQWTVLHPRSIDGAPFDAAREMGTRAIRALGLQTGFTHMEWFLREDGTQAIGEIAARPPGAQIVHANNYVHDADLHRAWARAVVDDAFDGPWERRYAVGVAFLRGPGRGRVASVTGVAEAQRRVAGLVADARLPTIGAPKSTSYEGDGWVVVRHPSTDVVADALRALVATIRVRYV